MENYKRNKLREILILTLLGVLMYVSQVIMSQLPNIEIVTLLIIITTRKFGYKALMAVYVFVGCEILTYGLSMWVMNYLYIWAILCLIILFLRKLDNNIFYAVLGGIYGLIFGSLCSIPYFISGGMNMGIVYIISGLKFDVLHCIGNLILIILLYTPLTKALDKAIKTA